MEPEKHDGDFPDVAEFNRRIGLDLPLEKADNTPDESPVPVDELGSVDSLQGPD